MAVDLSITMKPKEYKTPSEAKKEMHSSENQKILRKFVEREFVTNLGQVMDMYIEHNQDDYLEEFHLPQYEEPCRADGWYPIDEYRKKFNDRAPNKIDDDWHDAEFVNVQYGTISHASDWADLAYVDNIEPEFPEIYEHWAVTSYLSRRLKAKGEAVAQVLGFHVWGRCCTGQAIKLDNVIGEIAAELEILHGQRNDWSE